MPKDPMIRWLIWLTIGFSLGAPLLVAAVLVIS
jgi:hypothetical protein